jgi:hypothetical protein
MTDPTIAAASSQFLKELETMEGGMHPARREKVSMWEILVPTEKRIKSPPPPEYRVGIPNYPAELEAWQKRNSYTTRYHRVWDAEVRRITGGLTVLTPAKGQWVAPDGELFCERMIPVRIMGTRSQIDQIIDFTLMYYDQLAVFCAKVSDEVIIRHRK